MPAVPIVKLNTSQIEAAGTILARAFSEDSFFSYILPDPDTRFPALEYYSRSYAYASCLAGGVYGTLDPVTGIAVWGVPGSPVTPEHRNRSGLDRLPESFGTRAYRRYKHMVDFFESLIGRDVPTPHWYLSILGVDPDHQGKGLGGTLLQPALAQADEEGLPCYLETLEEKNLAFYLRHGFKVLVDDREPHSGLQFWTMIRS